MDSTLYHRAKLLWDTIRMVQRRCVSRHVARESAQGNGDDVLELTYPQLNTLLMVRDLGQTTIKDLAERLQVSAPSASSMVDRLVELGAATREQSQVDRREVVVRISPLGLSTIAVLERHILDQIVDLLERLGPDYAQRWCDVYARIREILQEEREEPELEPEKVEAV